MENEPDTAFEDIHVQRTDRVVGLVVVHRNAGREQHGRNSVLEEHTLVPDAAVEDIGEVLASEIVITEFKVCPVFQIAQTQDVGFFRSESIPAQ